MRRTLLNSGPVRLKPEAWRLNGSTVIIFLLAACAAAPVPPTNELLAAQTAIESAEQARVADYAAPELGEARDELNAAKAAVQLKDMTTALRLAERSPADAQLALARAQATKDRLVNAEMLNGTNSLKVEMRRNTGVEP